MTTTADNLAAEEVPAFRRALILLAGVLTVTLYFTTLMVASTVLPQIQGAMAATADEASWVMTFNILATAVATPMTGWLVANFGRRNVMVFCTAGFSMATLMCGLSGSLESLVVWRIAQGAMGAPTVPLTQTIILDTFPIRQQRMALGLFGMGVVLGPIIGPALGGYFAEEYSWRGAFYLLVGIGLTAMTTLRLTLEPDGNRPGVRFDWTGFLSLSVAVCCLQLVLARGQRLDWFDSYEINLATLCGAVSFYIFLAHSLTAEKPFINLKLLLNRNLALGYILVCLFGMLNFTPMVILPALLRSHAGFPDLLVGEVVGSRGIGGMIGFFAAMFIGRIDPRISMATGFVMQVIAGAWLMQMNLDVTPFELGLNGALQGASVGVIWVPLSIATFSTVSSKDRPEATALFHLLRNIAASLFISISVAEIVRTTGANYARMTELVNDFTATVMLPSILGGWDPGSVSGLARISKEIGRQAALLGYLNAFGLYTAASAIAIPFSLLLSRPRTEPPPDNSD